MKKSLLLGVAALAAVSFAAPAPVDAGEVKMGGYYMFRMQDSDSTPLQDAANTDDDNYWAHRLQLNMDFIASPKSHAHFVTRIMDSNTVQGAAGAYGTNSQAGDDGDANWEVRQAWLETEMWTVGVKVGEMPIALNDDILVNHDTTQFGTVMLSKTFGDTTVVLADVKMVEGSRGIQTGATTPAAASTPITAGLNQDEDDIDLYVASVLGKTARSCGNGCISYQLTAAYADAGNNSALTANTATGTSDTNNLWLAGTLGTKWRGIDLTATAIYEDGWDNYANNGQAGEDDFLVAVRANGKLSWGGWNGYAFYAGENFDNITAAEAAWSPTWDSGGPGAKDLMSAWAAQAFNAGGGSLAGSSGGTTNAGAVSGSSATENMWGVGAGVTFNAAGWTINPMLDYAEVADDTLAGTRATSESAWGGTLKLTHKIDQGVTFGLQGTFVDPDDQAGDAFTYDNMHYVAADLKLTF